MTGGCAYAICISVVRLLAARRCTLPSESEGCKFKSGYLQAVHAPWLKRLQVQIWLLASCTCPSESEGCKFRMGLWRLILYTRSNRWILFHNTCKFHTSKRATIAEIYPILLLHSLKRPFNGSHTHRQVWKCEFTECEQWKLYCQFIKLSFTIILLSLYYLLCARMVCSTSFPCELQVKFFMSCDLQTHLPMGWGTASDGIAEVQFFYMTVTFCFPAKIVGTLSPEQGFYYQGSILTVQGIYKGTLVDSRWWEKS